MTIFVDEVAEVICGCCGRPSVLCYERHSGYQLGRTYDIYHCPTCGTAQVEPMSADPAVYDFIYARIEDVPGYRRYAHYDRQVTEISDPMAYLANSEDVYWAIQQHIDDRALLARKLTILEAGSGLGYLTYALSKRGHDVQGIDISGIAVGRANRRFGQLFECADVIDYASRYKAAFDVIVMTELVEHVPNFADLVASAMEALKPRGELLITTPNRSSFDASAIWATENPPVHLWWFAEESMQVLARRLGCSVRFTDFRDFNTMHRRPNGFIDGRRQRDVPFYPPTLGREGEILHGVRSSLRSRRALARDVADRLGATESLLSLRHRLYVAHHGISARRPNMCAIFARD